MKKKTLKINDNLIECMRFSTVDGAKKYILKKVGRKLIFCRAHEYYVNI